MKYRVLKPFGRYKKGNILNDQKKDEKIIIARKLQEGETIEEVNEKMVKDNYENKMMEKTEEKKKK